MTKYRIQREKGMTCVAKQIDKGIWERVAHFENARLAIQFIKEQEGKDNDDDK